MVPESIVTPLSILIVLPTAIIGGAERVAFNLAMHLVDHGDNVTVYAMSRGPQSGWKELEGRQGFTLIVRSFPSEKRSLGPFAAAMFRLSRAETYDVVYSSHVHVNAALSALRFSGVLRCRHLVSRESTMIFDRFTGPKRVAANFFYRICYGRQDLLIYQTPAMRSSLIAALGYEPVRKGRILVNPVNIAFIDRMAKMKPLPAPKGKMIVACGRLVPIKGFDLLLEAFSDVAARQPDVELVILGQGTERQSLKKSVNDLGLEGKVSFPGHLDNPYRWFACADVGVISSLKEGFPNVILEMMSSGTRAIVSTPCTDGLNGLPNVHIIAKMSKQELCSAICDALDNNSDSRKAYRQYVEEVRSTSSYWQSIQEVLRAS